MTKVIKIAVDAMGGDGSPKKVIDGIIHHYESSKNSFYKIFGDSEKIKRLIPEKLKREDNVYGISSMLRLLLVLDEPKRN